MSRIRTGFIAGTTLNNPLAIGDVTLSSTNLSGLPAIVPPDIAAIVLDPVGINGVPEIVYVTAHTALATTATIARAQEGTTARSHLLAEAWAHGPTTQDFNQRRGTDIVAAATITLPNTEEDFFHITGTTTVTAISARQSGKRVVLEFTGACPITYNGTSLILTGGVSITTAAGDALEFISDDGVNWRQIIAPIQTASMKLVANVATPTSTTSTSAVDLVTITGLSIPVTSGIRTIFNFRKLGSAAKACYFGLKLNTIIIMEAISPFEVAATSAVMQAEDGICIIDIAPRRDNYLNGFNSSAISRVSAGGAVALTTATPTIGYSGPTPNATITSLAIRAVNDTTSNAAEVSSVQVWTLG